MPLTTLGVGPTTLLERSEMSKYTAESCDKYGPMYHWMIGLLYRHDNMRLCFNDVQEGAPYDEYTPEANTILPRIIALYKEDNLDTASAQKVLFEEFFKWFDGYGPAEDDFFEAAQEIADFFAGTPLVMSVNEWKMMNLI